MRRFAQFVTFSTTLLKVASLHGCFSGFLNCTPGTKSRKASHTHTSSYSKTLGKRRVVQWIKVRRRPGGVP